MCLFQIGVSEEDRARYQEIVAAILHIGEIAFVEKVRLANTLLSAPFSPSCWSSRSYIAFLLLE